MSEGILALLLALVADASAAFLIYERYLIRKDQLKMPTKKDQSNAKPRTRAGKTDQVESQLDFEFSSEFSDLPEILCTNLGIILRLAIRNGGYFGLSVTDDGGSARLAIRCSRFTLDKRVYQLRQLELIASTVYSKLRDAEHDGLPAGTVPEPDKTAEP